MISITLLHFSASFSFWKHQATIAYVMHFICRCQKPVPTFKADIVIYGHSTLQKPSLAIIYIIEASKSNEPHLHHVYVKFIHDKAAFVQPRISVGKLPIPEGLSRWWMPQALVSESESYPDGHFARSCLARIRACLHGGGGPQMGEVKCDGLTPPIM